MAEDIFKDLDLIDPPSKLVKMSGELIDIAFIPSKVTLAATRISTELKNNKIAVDEMFAKMIKVIVQISEKSNPKITEDWIYDNVSIEKITEFLQLLISSDAEEADETANPEGGSVKN